MALRYPHMNLVSAWMRYATAYTQMSVAAAEVIFRRSLRMSQGAMTGAEAVGMVMEKASAFALATEKAAVAAARGADPARIATAALRPITARARSNVRQLRR
jgi:hypothetical protein